MERAGAGMRGPPRGAEAAFVSSGTRVPLSHSKTNFPPGCWGASRLLYVGLVGASWCVCLQVLFRGVSMMVPDRRAIMKVKLASAGYMKNGDISLKFFLLYGLCEQQLSKQRHYDFGLRNILSVLRSAGSVLRQAQVKDEEFLFMRTLRDMNMSKLVFDDIELFISLLGMGRCVGCVMLCVPLGAAGENSIRTRPHETKPSQHRVTPEIPGIQVVRIFRGAEGERGRGSSFWERWMQEVAAPSA